VARILVVDDENNIRLMIRLALRADGHEVETAADGTEALEKFGDGGAWDLVLLDQRMPGLEGLEVLREMRRRSPAARVVMVTAFGTVDLASNALRAGATDFLRKPFTMEVLRGAVRTALAGGPAAGSSGVAQDPSQGERPAPVSLALSSINGYRIASDERTAASTATAAPAVAGGAIQHDFSVCGPDGVPHQCRVLLPPYVVELVKARGDCEAMPRNDQFWEWLCEEALANYLWQNADLPEGQFLQVDELSTNLRRWVEAVLS